MKRLLNCVCLVSLLLLISQNTYGKSRFSFEPRVGGGSNISIVKKDISQGEKFFYGADFYYRYGENVDLGLGFLVNTTLGEDKSQNEEYYIKNIPVYLSAKVYSEKNLFFKPYYKAFVGYQFVKDTDIDNIGNGMYYGTGVGINLLNFLIEGEVRYSKFGGGLKRNEFGFALSLGYKF